MKADLVEALHRLHPDAFGWALHCCRGNVDRAEDVLQNAYLKLVRPPPLQPPADPRVLKTWWFGVLRLTALEEARRARSGTSLMRRLKGWLGGDAQDDPALPALQVASQREYADRLRACLATLSDRQAEILHLVFYQGLAVSEAAGVMGVSVGSARQHYERGKARLRELLVEESTHA
jgi:RNA polymerase sigma-70 factor (ECF subfamily)